MGRTIVLTVTVGEWTSDWVLGITVVTGVCITNPRILCGRIDQVVTVSVVDSCSTDLRVFSQKDLKDCDHDDIRWFTGFPPGWWRY